ncbi:tetratricopeptide repeat protein [Nisaea sediminum]|uniref:tetratricopeptide repeat protein n=1 Tax=Nisaea sediminum TaxID=2775867 RepID=UPI00186821DF|nr:tetratricopeptide repeat protein [Nisaea sediminum]
MVNTPGTDRPAPAELQRQFTEALSLHEAGNLAAARPLYEQLFRYLGPVADLQHLYGTLLFQTGAARKGQAQIAKAILQRPDAASFYDHFGSAARAAGGTGPAAAAYERAGIINPAAGTAFLNAAIVALETGRPDIAVTRALRAVELIPENAEAWLRLGCAYQTIGEPAKALEALSRARDRAPANAEIYFHLRAAHLSLGETALADRATKCGILLDPQRFEFYANFRDGDISEISGRPGLVPRKLATILSPGSANAWNQLSATYYGDVRYEAAAEAARRAILLSPATVMFYNSLGTTSYQLGRFHESVRVSRHGLSVDPTFDDLGYNLSLSAFCTQDVETGWRYWPNRLGMKVAPLRVGIPPRWSPGSTVPDHLLVASEQGVGDDLRFLSPLRELLRDVKTVTVETDTRLHPLLKRTYPSIDLIPTQLRPGPQGKPTHDYTTLAAERGFTHSIFSGDLPAIYRSTPESWNETPCYLQPDPGYTAAWRERLNALGPGPYLGISWRSGTLITSHRAIHYNTIDELIQEIPTGDFTLVNLQYGDASGELADIRSKYGVVIHDFPDLNQTRELDRVFALMACMDLIVTPSTAALALACSAGVPVIGLGKAYFYFADGWDPMFPTHYPVKRPSDSTATSDRPQRVGAAVRHFLETGALPIRKP